MNRTATKGAGLGLDPAFLALVVPMALTLRRVLRDQMQGRPR